MPLLRSGPDRIDTSVREPISSAYLNKQTTCHFRACCGSLPDSGRSCRTPCQISPKKTLLERRGRAEFFDALDDVLLRELLANREHYVGTVVSVAIENDLS